MHLVGLYTYCKMIHGAYNVKKLLFPFPLRWAIYVLYAYILLTLLSRTHLQKLTILQLLKMFPELNGTRRLTTLFPRAHNLSSWDTFSLQFPPCLSKINFNSIVSLTTWSSNCSVFLKILPPDFCINVPFPSHLPHL